MLWLFRFITGYVRVLFSGESPEKILNIASSNRIFLWNSHITKNGIESCISVKDFKGIHHIIRGSGVKVHILKKYGLPFKVAKNRKRFGIAAGVAVFFIFLKLMSGYIWIINVTGNEKVNTNDIVSALENIGIREGVKRSFIDPKSQREKLLLEIDSLAWASLNVEGCRLTVNVSEIKNAKPEQSAPSNLKAAADGIIKKIDVNSGNCVVRSGDTVKTGDVLVSGIIEKAGGTEFVRSAGTVTAVTERSITVSGKYSQKIFDESGKVKKKCVLELFTLKIPLFLGKETQKYNFDLKTYDLSLFGQKLPIRIYEKEFRYVNEYQLNLNREKLCSKLEEEVSDILKKKNVEDYTITSRDITETADGITLTAIVTAEENIAVSEELLISEQEKQVLKTNELP